MDKERPSRIKHEAVTATPGGANHRTTQRALKGVIRNSLSAIDQALHSAISADRDQPENEGFAILLIQAAGVSLRSIALLLDESFMGARDALSLSRSICDACVNAAFLLVSEPAMGEKATRYITQRFHRDSHRRSTLGGLSIQITPHVSVPVGDVPNLDAAIAEFTSKSGREIREWSGYDIDAKIEAVHVHSSKAATSLAASRLAVYGISSEIIHGSPYGAIYFWTVGDKRTQLKLNVRRQLMGHYLHAVAGALFALDGALRVMSEKGSANVDAWRRAVRWDFLIKLIDINFESEPTDFDASVSTE